MTYDPWKTYSSNPDEVLLHATAVAVDGRGLLILGPSGSGKSCLAIEILALGADLISDDRIWLRKSEAGLMMHAAAPLSGRIEVRGLGLISCPTLSCAPLKYCIDLSLMSDARLPFAKEVTKFGHKVLVFPGAKIVPKAAALVLLVKNGSSAYS
jgi:HPr kinase/phosphorylase